MALDICERASANDMNAKQAAKSLRREFRYGEPASQLSAARVRLLSSIVLNTLVYSCHYSYGRS